MEIMCSQQLPRRMPLDRIEGPCAGRNMKLGIAVAAVWHVTDHYGQISRVSEDGRPRAAIHATLWSAGALIR